VHGGLRAVGVGMVFLIDLVVGAANSPYQGSPSTSFLGSTPSSSHCRTPRRTESSGELAPAMQRPRICGTVCVCFHGVFAATFSGGHIT
jgi:hypothetical protein